jgi:transporter family protein
MAFLKSVLVVSSWILAFYAMKHLPVTIFSPIRATGPFWTLAGAILLFGERLNLLQWIGVIVTLLFFYFFSIAGRSEGIHFRKNKWVLLIVVSTIISAASGLYDKYIISRIDRIAVQVWFSYYQVVVMLPVMALLWYPNRRKYTLFKWRWSIPLIGITLVVADFVYFRALSYEGAMISMISALRRGSVIVTFTVGAIIFKETNLKTKALYLLGILTGIVFITIGSR